MKMIKNGIINENPLLVLLLGLCPALAVTNNFENAYIMGLSLLFILVSSNIIISLLRKTIPDNVQIVVYVVIISTFVTLISLLLKEYAPSLNQALGIYLPILTVNCVILSRALAVASKEKVSKTFLDALGIGLGYTFALMLIGLIREVLGNNTITIMDGISSVTGYRMIYHVFPDNNFIPMNFIKEPSGAFIILGLVIALFNSIYKKEVKPNESN
ncbi:MAG: electron transport complex subunit RsxE [Bacilli bacterium]|nr:electron transport complex subunit RsxE [Bacilli bacterium]